MDASLTAFSSASHWFPGDMRFAVPYQYIGCIREYRTCTWMLGWYLRLGPVRCLSNDISCVFFSQSYYLRGVPSNLEISLLLWVE